MPSSMSIPRKLSPSDRAEFSNGQPLVFEDGSVLSGGNFHGEPVAMALDYLGIGVAEIGNIAEQRVQKLMNPAMSDLPAFLVEGSGLNSGFMVPQIVCSALASENKA